MKVILFGAGASKGDSGVPLTNDLFQLLKKEYPTTWGDIPSEKNKAFIDDFEIAMRDYLWPQSLEHKGCRTSFPNKEEQIRRSLIIDLARFFNKFQLNISNSLYFRFLNEIKADCQSYRIATLNYDTLLFQALKENEIFFEINGVKGLPSGQPTIPICLPHGCVNIYCAGGLTPDGSLHASKGIPVELIPTKCGGLSSRSEIGYLADQSEFNKKIESNIPFFPVICHIQPNKFTMYGQNFIDSQFRQWFEWTNKATHIVIIGVKCSSHTVRRDHNLWNAIANSPAKIMYISGSDGIFFKKCFDEIRPNQDTFFNSYWGDKLDEVLKFLNS